MRDSAPSTATTTGPGPCQPARRVGLAAAVAGLGWLALAPWAAAAPARAAPPRPAPPLPADVAALLAASGLPMASFGLQVQAVGAAALPLLVLQPEQPFQLASTAKLVTAMAALDLLGPDYRWRTSAYLGGPLRHGRLLGNLLIVGGGNALLRSSELRDWFAQLRAQGLREVLGDIVLDRQAFALKPQDFLGTPEPAIDRPHHIWPDALTLDAGRLRLRLDAGSDGRPQLRLEPPLAGVQLPQRLSAGSAACSLQALWRAPPAGRYDLPAVAAQGQWAPACGALEVEMAPLAHPEFTTRAVQALWREAGGRLRGRVIDSALHQRDSPPLTGPDGEALAPWSVHESAPLPELLRDINKRSDNLGARNLMLSLASGFPLRPATLAEARGRLAGWLRQQGLASDDLVLDNGSGLSRAERGKPRAMVQLLRQAWAGPQGPELLASLPVAGIDGTLAHRMTQGRATGRAYLKTGSLLDTRALAGYVMAYSGTTYALAAMVNHPDAGRATPALDKLVEWVVARA